MRAGFGDDGERTKILLRKLGRWPCRAEELGLDIGWRSNLKSWRQNLSGIGRSLVALLGLVHLFTQKGVKGVKIDGVLLSAYRQQISLREDR